MNLRADSHFVLKNLQTLSNPQLEEKCQANKIPSKILPPDNNNNSMATPNINSWYTLDHTSSSSCPFSVLPTDENFREEHRLLKWLRDCVDDFLSNSVCKHGVATISAKIEEMTIFVMIQEMFIEKEELVTEIVRELLLRENNNINSTQDSDEDEDDQEEQIAKMLLQEPNSIRIRKEQLNSLKKELQSKLLLLVKVPC